MKSQFDNIAISGGIGTGTTTLFNNLKNYLEPFGWDFKSTGQFVREYMRENLVPMATLVSDDFDRKIEEQVRKVFLTQKKKVVEGWLAGFISRDIKNTLRVLVVCSQESIRIDRVANRDKITINEAKKNIVIREQKNFKKWRRLYGDYNFFDPQYYHLVIDTYSSGQMETLGKVLDKLAFKIPRKK